MAAAAPCRVGRLASVGPMGTSSARPSALRTFASTAEAIDTDSLTPHVSPLRTALDTFRDTSGWPDFLSDIPPLDIDLGAVRGRLAQVAMFVGEVATGFEAADTDPDTDDVVTATDVFLGGHVSVDLDSQVTLLQDGDRWIYPGTEDSDFVRVGQVLGLTFIEVGVVAIEDGRRTVRWERRWLTREQASNLTIRTGGGDDFVGISPGVRVGITVWTGDGNDVVGMPGQHYSSRRGGGGGDRIFTGDGNDRVEGGAGDDEIYGGDGNDYIDGQGGDDRIVGGAGDDVLYGGAGDDEIHGGSGDDYLEGGSGDDVLRGNDGRDILSGGRGDDELHGGAGDDDLFGGRGDDSYHGGDGDDRVTAESGEARSGIEQSVLIELTGDPGSYAIDLGDQPDWMTDAEWENWRERLDSDIEFLRTTHSGRAGLEALDQASHDSDSRWNPFDSDDKVTILPYVPWNGGDPQPVSFDRYVEAMLNDEHLPGEDPGRAGPVDSLVRFDRSYAGGDLISYGQAKVTGYSHGPPSLTLHHELAHAYDGLRGGVSDRDQPYTEVLRDADGNVVLDADGNERRAEVPRAELNSVGFDIDGDGEPDTVPTGDGSDHPVELTENALRTELRRPWRDSYTMGTEDHRRDGEHVTYENAD